MDQSLLRILVVGRVNDDDFYKDLLIHDYNQDYEIEHVDTADQAYQIATKFKPDCMLVDQLIYEALGSSFVKRMQKQNNDTPVAYVLLTQAKVDPLVFQLKTNSAAYRLYMEFQIEKMHHMIMQAIEQIKISPAIRSLYYFDEALNHDEKQKIQTVLSLEEAIVKNELSLRYQPIFQLEHQHVIGFEMLMRWEHPHIDIFGPRSFLPLAERSGLMFQLTEWSLKQGLHDYNSWGSSLGQLFIKLSPSLLQDELWLETMNHLIDESGVDRANITFECSVKMLKKELRFYKSRLNALRDEGYSVCLRGVGVDAAHINYIADVNANYIKLSQQLVRRIDVHDQKSQYTIKDLFNAAHDNSYQVIATGIESEDVVSKLLSLGCDQGQGYAMSVPLKAEGIRKLLQTKEETRKIKARKN